MCCSQSGLMVNSYLADALAQLRFQVADSDSDDDDDEISDDEWD